MCINIAIPSPRSGQQTTTESSVMPPVKKYESVFTKYLERSNEELKKRTYDKSLKFNKTFIKSMFPRLSNLHRLGHESVVNQSDSDPTSVLHTTNSASSKMGHTVKFIDMKRLKESSAVNKKKFQENHSKLYRIYQLDSA